MLVLIGTAATTGAATRWALPLLVVAHAASAQVLSKSIRSGGLSPERFPSGRVGASAADPSLLRFLPSISASDECTGAALTGTAGQPLTFTRTSSAYCTKSDGTLVLLGSNQPRLEGNGLLIEEARTNVALNSQDFSNAIWNKDNTGASSPVVTQNTTDLLAPDGTQTAAKVVFPAISVASSASYVWQSVVPAAAARSASIYLRSASGTSTIYLFILNNSTYYTAACPVTTTWTRCKAENKTLLSAATYMILGVDLRDAGQSAQAAQTVYAWGAQLETGTFSTSYVATVGTTVVRSSDAPVFTLASIPGLSGSAGCLVATITFPAATAAGPRILGFDTNDTPGYLAAGNAFGYFCSTAGCVTNNSTTTTLAGSQRDLTSRWSQAADAGSIYMTGASAPTTGPFGGYAVTGGLRIGMHGGNVSQLGGHVKNLTLNGTYGACP